MVLVGAWPLHSSLDSCSDTRVVAVLTHAWTRLEWDFRIGQNSQGRAGGIVVKRIKGSEQNWLIELAYDINIFIIIMNAFKRSVVNVVVRPREGEDLMQGAPAKCLITVKCFLHSCIWRVGLNGNMSTIYCKPNISSMFFCCFAFSFRWSWLWGVGVTGCSHRKFRYLPRFWNMI